MVVTPKAGKDGIVGWKEDASGVRELAVRVTAAPEGGKATKEVCKLVAASARLPKSGVTCVRGDVSRHKQLELDCSQEYFDAWIAQFEDRLE